MPLGEVGLGALAGQVRPQVPGAGVGRRPWGTGGGARGLARLEAVAVAVGAALSGVVAVSVVAGPAGSLYRDLLVEDVEGGLDVGVADGQLTQARQFLEAAVDDRALVHGGPAVAEAVGDRGVRVAGLGHPDEVARAVGAGGGHRPGLDHALEVVGGGLVQLGPGRVAVCFCDHGGRGQPGDLGGDGGRRIAGLLFPALDAERRPVGDQEVRGRADVVLVEGFIAAQPGLQRHQDRVGGLVQLGTAGVGGGLAVEQRVARHRAVRELLLVEQEQRRRAGRL